MFASLPMGFRTLSKSRLRSYGHIYGRMHKTLSTYSHSPVSESLESCYKRPERVATASQNPAYGYRVVGWQVEKQGNRPDECEDVWLHEQGVIALADGATETSFAQEWAQHLVRSLAHDPWGGGMAILEKMPDWQKYWQHWLAAQDLTWFARRKAQQGSAATMVALRFDHTGAWQGVAVGDSCLFGVRWDPLTNADYCFLQLPQLKASEFTTRPPLVHSHYPLSALALQYAKGYAQGGDRFYLMTDALALWWVQQMELGQKPWQTFDQMGQVDDFRAWVERQRETIGQNDQPYGKRRQPHPLLHDASEALTAPPDLGLHSLGWDNLDFHNDDTTLIQIQMLGQDALL